MKFYTTFIFCFLLPLLLCDDLGGVKVAINERFISNIIRDFEPEIKKVLTKIQIPDSGNLEDGEFGVPNFNMNMVKLEFGNDGILNLRISNCEPYFSGAYYYRIIFRFHNNFNAKFKNFNLNARIRVTSRPLPGGGYGPDAQFISGPDINFTLDISTDGFLHGLISWIINKCQNFVKPFILPKIRDKARDALTNVLRNFKTKAPIGNGFWLDFTLASPIRLKNRFIELNSYAHLYSERLALTKNRNKFPLTLLPSINNLGRNLQIYVGEYSINSALFTLLSSANRAISFKVGTKILNSLLPGIVDKYGDRVADVTLTGSPDSKVQITEKYMEVIVPSNLNIRFDRNTVFNCNLDLDLKVNVQIKAGPKISGEVKELSAKIKQVNINTASNAANSLIEQGFSLLQSTIIPLLNVFIEKNIALQFPTVMGITFTNVSLNLKNKYFAIDYDITRAGTSGNRGIRKCLRYGYVYQNFLRRRTSVRRCVQWA